VRAKPSVWDPNLELLAERGTIHEKGYVAHLQAAGLSIKVIEGMGIDPAAVAQTLKAMQGGAPIIVQGALQSGRWGGRTDVLRRVERPSHLGSWSYEVIDTKLARETIASRTQSTPRNSASDLAANGSIRKTAAWARWYKNRR
jgi:uncharacterized protein